MLKKLSPTSKIIGIVIIAFIILWAISNYINVQENLDYGVYPSKDDSELIPGQELIDSVMPQPVADSFPVQPSDVMFNSSGKDITPLDLLPSSADANAFDAQFPSAAGGDLSSKNFLTAGYSIGINTVSSSLRNANTQIRSDPFIPTKVVGPWGQSTIVPDLNRKQLDIGVSSSC